MKVKKSNPTVANVNCPTSAQTSIKASLHSASVHPSRSQRYNEIINTVTLHLAKYMCPLNKVSWKWSTYWTKDMMSLIWQYLPVCKTVQGNREASHGSQVLCFAHSSHSGGMNRVKAFRFCFEEIHIGLLNAHHISLLRCFNYQECSKM